MGYDRFAMNKSQKMKIRSCNIKDQNQVIINLQVRETNISVLNYYKNLDHTNDNIDEQKLSMTDFP